MTDKTKIFHIRRVPVAVHAALKKLAKADDRSLESYLRQLLAEHVKPKTS